MNQDKEVVSAIISLISIHYSCFAELLGVLIMILVQKRLLRKRFLLFMNLKHKIDMFAKFLMKFLLIAL